MTYRYIVTAPPDLGPHRLLGPVSLYLDKYSILTFYFQELEKALNKFGDKWEFNPGDGAFYGPKVSLYA